MTEQQNKGQFRKQVLGTYTAIETTGVGIAGVLATSLGFAIEEARAPGAEAACIKRLVSMYDAGKNEAQIERALNVHVSMGLKQSKRPWVQDMLFT